MTKRDYELVLNVLSRWISRSEPNLYALLVVELSKAFQRDNPRFNSNIWYDYAAKARKNAE